MKKEQLRELTRDELLQRRSEAEQEMFNLRLQKGTKELDNPLKLRVLRRDISRINTILREDELRIRQLAQKDGAAVTTNEKQE